jgi:hypothetical protein
MTTSADKQPTDQLAPYDIALRDAWDEFCEGLKGQLDLVFRPDAPTTELDRAWGVRYMSRYINKALNDVLEYLDPDFPQLWVMQHPTSKSFGDNPDCTYLVTRIDGSKTYRIVGNRGTVNWVRFVLTPYEELVGGSVLTGANVLTLADEDLQVEWDGSFVVTLSPDPHTGNWIKTAPGMSRLMIRQFFGEWDKERPLTARIERVGQEGERPAKLTAARMTQAFRDANNYIAKDADRWYRFVTFYREKPNQFIAGRPTWAGGTVVEAERTVGRWLNLCYWQLEPDEAFLIEFDPPETFMWLFELDNFWMNSVDYRYHLSSINSKQAVLEEDGSARIAISNLDPGIPNWLDPAGHLEGLINGRWIRPTPAAENVSPSGRIVKVAELPQILPPSARRITREERLAQLRRLRIGVENRFGPGR